MSRKSLIRSNHFPYHVTARANNREPFPIDLSELWRIFSDESYVAGVLFQAQIHSLVLMPNHFHLLVSTPEEDLGVLMKEFMRSITQTTNRKCGRTGRIFGAGYHWTLVDSPIYFSHAYKYVYRNPVRAGLCSLVEEYPWSTVEKCDSLGVQEFPLWFPFGWRDFFLIPNEACERLKWLNTAFLSEQEDQVRKSLKKTIFAPERKGWKRAISELGQAKLI